MGSVNGTSVFILGLEYTIIVSSCFISALGIAGNTCVLMVCAKLNKEAGLYAIYYASLAVSDLLLSGPCLIPQIWAQNEGHFVEVDYFWVQVWGFTYITARMSSILTLSVISLERMLAVMTPHFYRRVTRSHAILLVAMCWMLSLVVGVSPYWAGEDYEYFKGAATASPNRALASDPKYIIVTEVLSLYLPSAVVVVSVILISWRVSNLQKKAQNVTATLLTVFFAYIVCFTPYFIFTLLIMTGVVYKLPITVQLYTQNFCFLILTAHSAMNPIIYAFKAGQFKDEIKQLEDQALWNYLRALLSFYKGKSPTNSETCQLPTVHRTYQKKTADALESP